MNKAYEYCVRAVNGGSTYGKYIKLQAQRFIDICDEKVQNAHFDERRYKRLCSLLKIMNQSTGSAAGISFYDSLAGFQWLILCAVYCLVDDKGIRFVQNLTLQIARKNGKSLISGLILLIALLTEPRFTKLYSISVNHQLAMETYQAMKQILQSSPALYDESLGLKQGKGKNAKFYITNLNIKCNLTDNSYTPLSNNKKALDGKLVSLGVVDEFGALADNGPASAMRASQITLDEKLTIIISTKYPGQTPMESEVAYAKRVLDGITDDPHYFSLLYEPDKELIDQWQTNDDVIRQSNPLALEVDTIWNALLLLREKAAMNAEEKGYFLTKNLNIQANDSSEEFIDPNALKKCEVPRGSIDWKGKRVVVGADFSNTIDNSAISMVARDDDGKLIILPMAFIPADRIDEKSRTERIDYRAYVNSGQCIACGDTTIDYSTIEQYVLAIEEKFGCEVVQVFSDPWNAQSSCQKWKEGGLQVVLLKQLSYILHEATAGLKKEIMDGNVKFEKNQLFEINCSNAIVMLDTSLHQYVNKKKSTGKIDELAATINAVYGLYKLELQDTNFGAYTI